VNTPNPLRSMTYRLVIPAAMLLAVSLLLLRLA
jgi:hypothetical protein